MFPQGDEMPASHTEVSGFDSQLSPSHCKNLGNEPDRKMGTHLFFLSTYLYLSYLPPSISNSCLSNKLMLFNLGMRFFHVSNRSSKYRFPRVINSAHKDNGGVWERLAAFGCLCALIQSIQLPFFLLPFIVPPT